MKVMIRKDVVIRNERRGKPPARRLVRKRSKTSTISRDFRKTS
jgi:hypothetical protein